MDGRVPEANRTLHNSKQEIISSIDNYIREIGGNYSDWYVCLRRSFWNLFYDEPNIEAPYWIYRRIASPEIAREVISHFVNVLGTDGNVDKESNAGSLVFVYKKRTGKTTNMGKNG